MTISGTGSIKYRAFYDNKDIVSATIEKGITSIGAHAFINTSNMESISIPNSVVTLGGWAFASSGLKSLVLPDSARKDGTDTRYMCGGCNNLEEFILPANWGNRLGELLIADTPKLKRFVVPEAVTFESWTNWNLNTGATLYCTASQISKGICNSNSIRYEKDANGNYVAYKSDGSIDSVFENFSDFQKDKTVNEYYAKDIEGNGLKYDGRGNLLGIQYLDGSTAVVKDGKIVGMTKRGPFTIPEANALTKDGPVNTVTITW